MDDDEYDEDFSFEDEGFEDEDLEDDDRGDIHLEEEEVDDGQFDDEPLDEDDLGNDEIQRSEDQEAALAEAYEQLLQKAIDEEPDPGSRTPQRRPVDERRSMAALEAQIVEDIFTNRGYGRKKDNYTFTNQELTKNYTENVRLLNSIIRIEKHEVNSVLGRTVFIRWTFKANRLVRRKGSRAIKIMNTTGHTCARRLRSIGATTTTRLLGKTRTSLSDFEM